MKYLAIFLLHTLCAVSASTKIYFSDEPIQQIGDRLYKKILLTNEFNDPKELVYDSSSRNLFFMYMDDKLQNSGRAFVNTITKKTMKITGVENNKATAVDSDTSEVYFGTNNGLYKLDPITNKAFYIGLNNVNILKLVIRNNEIYLVDGNNHKIYKAIRNASKISKVGNWKTVMEFDVDNSKNIHFVTMCGVYCAANDSGGVVKNKDLSMVYHFMVDGDKTLGLSNDGLYNINCSNGTAEKIAVLDFFPRSIILGDYGDIYYSLDNNIYRLKPLSSYVIYHLRRKNI